MNRHPHRSFGHGEALSDPAVGSAIAFAGQDASHLPEQRPLAVGLAFAFERIHGLLEDRERPLPLELLFRRLVVGRFQTVALLRCLSIERNETEGSPALLPVSAAPFPREEVVEHREEKGAKPPLVAIGQTQMLFADQPREKLLSEIL